MHPLMLLAATAACVFARPPGATLLNALPPATGPLQERSRPQTLREALTEYMLAEYFVPHYMRMDERVHHRNPPAPPHDYDWLTRNIDPMKIDYEEYDIYEPDDANSDSLLSIYDPQTPLIVPAPFTGSRRKVTSSPEGIPHTTKKENGGYDRKRFFAFTPLERGFFTPREHVLKPSSFQSPPAIPIHRRDETPPAGMDPRQIRQNPNLSKTKTLVTENLDKLRNGMPGKDYRIPVSLLPTNLQLLKISHADDELSKERSHKEESSAGHHHHIQILESGSRNPVESIYGVAVFAAMFAAIIVGVFVFAVGVYTFTKKAKAAADVDYPAYGVTGPTVDSSGDRKLAQSAHMYHYQHQKQQILAMERNCVDQRDGSVSDPESEDENEEGDYTVYECPGFATTGDMEVKNPMFSEEPTPITPGKVELVKPQEKK